MTPRPKAARIRGSAFFTAICAVAAALASPAIAQQVPVGRGEVVARIAGLRPGQYLWAPRAAPAGPMMLIVNLRAQRAILYRNGVPIAASTTSTGSAGRETPTGIFTILEKDADHRSRTYDNAPMPFMQRLTWKGVALHAGHLPGYPASHGCVRLPIGFAKLLYGVSSLGMTVVITDSPSAPRIAPSPQLALASSGAEPPPDRGDVEWNPEKAPSGPVSIVISTADGRAIVLRNGVPIGSAPVRVEGPVTGASAYTLRNVDAQGEHWLRFDGGGERVITPAEFQRFTTPERFRTAVRALVRPGTTIVVTPDSLASGHVAEAATVFESTAP